MILTSQHRTRIYTLTLCGSGRADKVMRALTSASWADAHVLVNTHPKGGFTDTFDAAVAWCTAHGRPYYQHAVPFRNFGEALTLSWRLACEHLNPTDWIVRLDTDQVLDFVGMPEVVLELGPHINVLDAPDNLNSTKERALKANPLHQWVGRTHEYLAHSGPITRITPSGWSLSEAEKTGEELDEKDRRDMVLLLEDIRDGFPTAENRTLAVARAWYYVGLCHARLGAPSKAVKCFDSCYRTSPVPEQAALAAYEAGMATKIGNSWEWWGKALGRYPLAEACYRLAASAKNVGDLQRALTWSLTGLTMYGHPRTVFDAPKWLPHGFASIGLTCTTDPQLIARLKEFLP